MRAAEHEPIARVLPMLSVPHLDREFDYLVSTEQSDDAQPGVRVRVRFHGRLVDAFVLERLSSSDHVGQLGWLDRVISTEPVLTPEVRRLVDAVAARYGGTRPDVLRLAIPPRHAGAEKAQRPTVLVPVIDPVDPAGWGSYSGGAAFLDALRAGRAARAVWQALPGEDWCARLAEAAAVAIAAGHGVLVVVPDQRDIDVLFKAAIARVDESAVVALSAGLGPSARYRRWLSVLRGEARLVIGTRSAVFAPVDRLGLVMVWDDGDDSLAEPRAPYPHAREVAMLRAHQLRCAAIVGGYARTAEAHALVTSGWAHNLVAPRPVVRAAAPRVVAIDDDGYAEERDPAARTARLPSMALRAARASLDRGAPVLVQVPRRGYVPTVACARCRTVARCRHCMGPLSLSDRDAEGVVCRWCGRVDATPRCRRCGADGIRAVVVGARRTAEELGRAFAGTPVITSAGDAVHTEIPSGPALVVATPGAEPRAPRGYGAALLLDAWSLLGRADLRAAEDTLRRWMSAAAQVRGRADGGVVAVVADSSLPTVQALIRWDPLGHAESELAGRTAVGLPPAVHMAAVDGTSEAAAALIETAQLPPGADVLGPVDLPPGPALVVATPGAEPKAPEGYGAALLLDAWSLLGRADLRAAEDTLRRWMSAAAQVRGRADGGVVAVVADSSLPTVQALIRWDPLGHAESELAGRTAVGLPPAVHMAAVDGASEAVAALIETAQLPPDAEVLGPVDLPPGVRRPPGSGEEPVIRMLIRVRRDEGLALAGALRQATAVRGARHDNDAVRVQIDPLHIG